MTDRYKSRASTHADDCWSWGHGHYECAVGKVERLLENWIEAELLAWLAMRRQGMSFREIERITGRSRNVVARECKRAEQ